MTTPISPTHNAPAPAAPTPPAAGGATDAFSNVSGDNFMKLLVAQLKYQDPMNPADSTQFLAQTAQFTQVEKLADLDTKITAVLANSQNSMAAGLIGDTVTMGAGGTAPDVTGIVTSMRLTADGPLLKIGTHELNLSTLKSITAPTPVQPSTTNPPAA